MQISKSTQPVCGYQGQQAKAKYMYISWYNIVCVTKVVFKLGQLKELLDKFFKICYIGSATPVPALQIYCINMKTTFRN